MESVVIAIREQLRYIEGSPSVQMQVLPPDLGPVREEIDREIWEENEEKEGRRRERERGRGTRGELVE